MLAHIAVRWFGSREKRYIHTIMFKPLLALCLQRPQWPKPEDSHYWIQRMEKQTPPFMGVEVQNTVGWFFSFCELLQRLITKSYLSGPLRGSYEIRLLAWSWHIVGLP